MTFAAHLDEAWREAKRAEDDAGRELAEHGGLAHALGRLPGELGGEEDEDQREEEGTQLLAPGR